MCAAIDELCEEMRAEGWAKGHADGRAEGWAEGEQDIALLFQKLLADGKIEELEQVVHDTVYRHRKMKQYGIIPSKVDDY